MMSELLARLQWRQAASLMRKYGHTHDEIVSLYKSRFHLSQQDWATAYEEAAKACRSVVERVNERVRWKKELQEAYQRIIPA
jgi:regulator of replication initiation timing